MAVQMFPVQAGPWLVPARFRLRPSYSVATWAEAYCTDEATDSSAPVEQLARRLLHYVELGFAASIANVPALAKHEVPRQASFTSSRVVASFRLANERLGRELEELGLTERPTSVSMAAIHFDGPVGRLVSSGSMFDLWHVSRGAFRWVRQRRFPLGLDGGPALAPEIAELALEDGDVLGLGWMHGIDERAVAARADRIDDLLFYLLGQAEMGPTAGIVCRSRR